MVMDWIPYGVPLEEKLVVVHQKDISLRVSK